MKEKVIWDWMREQANLWAKFGCQEAADALQALIDKGAEPQEVETPMTDEARKAAAFTMLLTLLDRIELEEDHTLAAQRFEIAEQCGFTILSREQVSGRHQ